MGQGKVWRVEAPGKVAQENGYVLVCESTDPGWTPLFVNASAIIIERGGMLSHGAVVAREMGKPAVVLADAMRLLGDGEMVTVDGMQGVVLRAKKAGASEVAAVAGEKTEAPAIDENDERVAPGKMPPAESGKERAGSRAALIGLLVWGVYLLFVWRSDWVWRGSLLALRIASCGRWFGRAGGFGAW